MAGCSASLCSSPLTGIWLWALFFFCWAYPGKIWGKENEKSNQYSCYVHVMYLLLLFLEIIPAILTTIRNNVMCTPYSMHYFRLYSAIGSTFITTTYRRNRRNSQKKKKKKRKEKKRKEEFLDASSRGLSVEITMLRVNISFQFGLKSGGQILD